MLRAIFGVTGMSQILGESPNACSFAVVILACIIVAAGVTALGLLIMAWATDDIGFD